MPRSMHTNGAVFKGTVRRRLAHGHGCRTSITWITLWVVPAKAVRSYHANVLVSAPSAVWSRFGFRIKAKVNAPKPKKTVKTHKGKV